MKLAIDCALVGLGGMLGSVSRYLLCLLSMKFCTNFPLGTLLVNVIGSFIIGILGEIASSEAGLHPHLKLALISGFCGGFTTMSSFAAESGELVKAGAHFHAFSNVLLTLALCFSALWLGALLARWKFS